MRVRAAPPPTTEFTHGETLRAEYAADTLVMTLRRLKLLAMAVPIAVIIILEAVRTSLIPQTLSLPARFLLDTIAVGGVVLFSLFIFRFVANIQKQLERQNAELLGLHSAGLAVTSELSLDSVLRKVVERARDLVGARYGALSVIDLQGRIQQFITSGISEEERAAIGPPPVGHGVLGVVLMEGQHLRLANVTTHPRSAGFPPNHPVMRTLLAVPILCSSPFRGNLYLSEKNDGGQFADGDERTLERFAVQAAIAIDNAHLHAQAADLAVATERLRISHEMHDGLAQVLGYVNTKVQAAEAYMKRGKNEEATEQLHELAVAARQAYGEVRQGIVDLRTLPDPTQAIHEALREYVNRWKEQAGIAADLSISEDLLLRPAVRLQLVRIVQEALANVRQHARATKASVDIRRVDGTLRVTIKDDGAGFDPAAKPRTEFPRFGLSTMRERANSIGGTLAVESARGQGTTVRFEVPSQDLL
jgi:signal transduction histidine kinase